MLDKNFRSTRILELAEECPHCMRCGRGQKGWIVACHSNSQLFGKGEGLKASDVPIAYLCGICHDLVDHPAPSEHLSRMDREYMFYMAACKTWLWLMREGYLEIK